MLLHDLLLTLEEKHFNDITLKVGLGWSNSLAEGNIRCGKGERGDSTLKDACCLMMRSSSCR